MVFNQKKIEVYWNSMVATAEFGKQVQHCCIYSSRVKKIQKVEIWCPQQLLFRNYGKRERFWTISELPSGKRLHNELEHHHAFCMGKLTISRGIFYVANCKRLPGRVANIQEMHLNDDLNELKVSLWSVAALQVSNMSTPDETKPWQLGGVLQ